MVASISAMLLLPALAAAQNQVPLVDQVKGWFGKATNYVQSSVPSAVSNPIDTGASKVAQASVTPITVENWPGILTSSSNAKGTDPDEWLIYITGANKTCYGLCGQADTAWNESTALIAATPKAPHLAVLDCDTDPVLCNAWAVGPPMVIHAFLPQPLPDQSTPATTMRFIALNRTSVAASDIWEIPSSGKGTYEETKPYEGLWHPIDGQLAKLGLSIPIGTVIKYVAMVPSWAFMIGISFFSRTFMSRRMGGQGQARGGAAPAAQ
ncbi:MAG: hypothetical protein M1820_007955 [Bogoriella megaspora]|nr:MAG: hypothetical protein M1820_007955 [Bogoriella megaspora]